MSDTIVYTFSHNGEQFPTPPVPVSMSRDAIKAAAASRWPEVANAVMNISADNVITFSLPTAGKQ